MATHRALSALLLLWTVCSGPQATQWLAEQDQTLTGKVFNDHVLFATDDVSGGSLLGCARICSKAKDCVSFTFNKNATSYDVCRGHTSTVTSFFSHVNSAVARLYHAKEMSGMDEHNCLLPKNDVHGATRGVTVSTSAFLAYHQCYSAGSSLAWGLNLRV